MKIKQIFGDILKTTKKLVVTKSKQFKNVFMTNSSKPNKPTVTKKIFGKVVNTANNVKNGLLDIFGGLFSGAVVYSIFNWVADDKNKPLIKKILDVLRFGLQAIINIADFGVERLLDGFSKIVGKNTILERFTGIVEFLIGFFTLKWLLNPLSILKDAKNIVSLIKNIPSAVSSVKSFFSGIGNAVKGLLAWSSKLGKGVFSWFGSLVSKSLGKLLSGKLAGLLGKGASGLGKLVGNFIPKSLLANVGKILTKVPVIGSLLGVIINMLLGDSPNKAIFKGITGGIGMWLGGMLGTLFPPSIPFTVIIGGMVGDFLGDKVFDVVSNIPKLATGGLVKNTSKDGTHVIVAEKEDEYVIPASYLKDKSFLNILDNVKVVGAGIIGAVTNAIASLGILGNNISSSILSDIAFLSKSFGITNIKTNKNSVTTNNINFNKNYQNNNRGFTFDSNYDRILGVTQNKDNSVKGILNGILDIFVNGNLFKSNNIVDMVTNTIQHVQTLPNTIANNVTNFFNQPSVAEPKNANFIAVGNSSFYDPNDPTDLTAGGQKLSTGEFYNPNEFTAAAFPQLIHLLPKELTSPTRERPAFFKGKTIKRPFKVKVVSIETGKAAIIKVNDVGSNEGNKDPKRMLDMNVKSRDYFGVNAKNLKIYLVPDNTPTGIVKSFSEGGVFKINTNGYQHYAAPRRNGRKHAGQDFPVGKNQQFQSFVGGIVKFIGFQPGKNLYGHYVDIFNEKLGVTERIAEGGVVHVKVGDSVTPGQTVTTGTSTGVIHYEIRPMKEYDTKYYFTGTVDPIQYLNSIGAITKLAQNIVKNNASIALKPKDVIVSDNNTINASPNTQNVTSNPIEPDFNVISNSLKTVTQMLGLNEEPVMNTVYVNIGNNNISNTLTDYRKLNIKQPKTNFNKY